MPNLASLTDYDYSTPNKEDAISIRPVGNDQGYIEARPEPRPEPMPAFNDFNASLGEKIDKVLNKLTGSAGEERYQLWPEKVVREGLGAAGDVIAGKVPQWAVDNTTGDVHTSPQMIESAQQISALAGTGGAAGTTDATLGATPFLRPALKYKDKLYKGKEGQQHLDVIPENLYKDFNQKAMSGEDINDYNFGFVNDKGHFLDREKALQYGIDTGLVDPQAGKFGALTSTLMADSSKPGTAIEAVKNWHVKGHEDQSWYHGTTHNFDKFSLAKGNIENHLGQYPHFTNSPKDASANYAGHGPDLTGRIEKKAEELMNYEESEKGKTFKWGTDEYKKAYEDAKAKAAKEIAGPHEGAIIPAKLKMENPADITPQGKTWIDFSPKYDKEGEWIKENPNTFKLLNSLKKQGEKYGFSGQKVFDEIGEKLELYDSVKAYDLNKALRDNEELMSVAEHPKGKGMAGSHVIANVFKDLGFDGIVMDAKSAFPNMKNIDEGTLHAVPLKKNTVASKLTGKVLFSGTALPAGYKLIPVDHNPFEE